MPSWWQLVSPLVDEQGEANRAAVPCRANSMRSSSCFPDIASSCRNAAWRRGWLELAEQNARHLLESLRLESFESDERAEDPVYALGRELGLTVVPRVFICVDISTRPGARHRRVARHLRRRPAAKKAQSTASSGSRAWRSRTTLQAIHEVVTRYFRRRIDEAKSFPDLIVIDGGKGQLSAALEAMTALGLAERFRSSRSRNGMRRSIFPAGARAAAGDCRAGVRRSVCCSAHATRHIDLAWRTIATGLRRAHHHVGAALGAFRAWDRITAAYPVAGLRLARRCSRRNHRRCCGTARLLRTTGYPDSRLPEGTLNGLISSSRSRICRHHRRTWMAFLPSAPRAGVPGWCATLPSREHPVTERAEARRRHGMWRYRSCFAARDQVKSQ